LIKANPTQKIKVAQKTPYNIIRELGVERIELLKNTPEEHHPCNKAITEKKKKKNKKNKKGLPIILTKIEVLTKS
jgi:hypothetical protein